MINGVHHVNLATANMDRLLAFYRDELGLRQRSDKWLEPGNEAFEAVVGLPDARVRTAQLHAGNIRLEIFSYQQPEPGEAVRSRACDVGIRHIAFDVTNIDEEYDRLVAVGVEFLSAPQMLAAGTVRAAYLRDPDGNIVELQEVLPGGFVDRTHIVGLPES